MAPGSFWFMFGPLNMAALLYLDRHNSHKSSTYPVDVHIMIVLYFQLSVFTQGTLL